MKKEKQIRTYQRRTKSGKMVTVRAHTAKYDAADKAKEMATKKGAGKELEDRKKKTEEVQLEIPFDWKDKVEKEKEKVEKVTDKETSEPKKKTAKKTEPKKDSGAKKSSSEPAFTAAEFKEWYRGTGSAADKKVAKALRAQLGRSGYRKLEDEAIDGYSARGHLEMFKRVSGGGKASSGKSEMTKNSGKESTGTKSSTTKRVTSKGDYTPAFRDYVKKSGYELNKYGVLLKGGKPVENGYNITQSFAKAYRSGSKPTLPKQSSGRLTAVEKAYADYHKEQGRKGKPDYSSEEFMDFVSTYKKQGSPRASKSSKSAASSGVLQR